MKPTDAQAHKIIAALAGPDHSHGQPSCEVGVMGRVKSSVGCTYGYPRLAPAGAKAEELCKDRPMKMGKNEFDFVASHMVTHHIPDWHEALLQMLGVLRPNGYLIYKDFSLLSWLASIGEKIVRSMGFPTADEPDRFARENHLTPIRRAQTFTKYEVVWQKHAE